MATELEALVKKIQPTYVGYLDQYKAILYVLGVDPDAPAGTCAKAIQLAKTIES